MCNDGKISKHSHPVKSRSIFMIPKGALFRDHQARPNYDDGVEGVTAGRRQSVEQQLSNRVGQGSDIVQLLVSREMAGVWNVSFWLAFFLTRLVIVVIVALRSQAFPMMPPHIHQLPSQNFGCCPIPQIPFGH